MSLIIRQATAADHTSIHKLLTLADVSTTGLEAHIHNYVVLENPNENRIVGTVGLEIYPENERLYGLMRSLVLDHSAIEAKMGVELLRLFVAYAQTKELDALYLFTLPTGKDLFIHMGFSTVEKDNLPACILQSPSFSEHTSAEILPMVFSYASTTYPQRGVDIVEN